MSRRAPGTASGMEYAALTAWLATATVGTYMLLRVAAGPRDPSGAVPSALPDSVLLLHPFLALVGLGAWGVFLANDDGTWAWIAFVDLLIVATLGDVLLLKWKKSRHERTLASGTPYAESRISLGVTATHGVLAALTIGLVLGSALTT